MFVAADQYCVFHERSCIMDAIRNYLISITAAAMIAGIVTGITKKSGSISSIIRLLAGLFMTVTILHPILDIRISKLQIYLEQLSFDADHAADIGKKAAEDEIKQRIAEKACAYILEKANDLGADLQVKVMLHDLAPCAVRISGPVSPYAKQQLSNYITTNLGISLEDQQWTG